VLQSTQANGSLCKFGINAWGNALPLRSDYLTGRGDLTFPPPSDLGQTARKLFQHN